MQPVKTKTLITNKRVLSSANVAHPLCQQGEVGINGAREHGWAHCHSDASVHG
jgi:hypothetical protein